MPRLPSLTVALALLACGAEAAPPAPAATPPPASPAPGAAPTAPPPAAPTPVAAPTPPPPAGPPIELLHAARAAVATSSAYDDDADQVASLVDGSLETAWNSRTGDLTGAWIEVRLPEDATVTSIGMTAGFTHVSPRADLFPGNHRVARVRVLHDGVEVGSYPLDPELRTLQTLPVTGGGGVYRIEIAEVLPGTNATWREVCVSELVVMGHAPGVTAGAAVPVTAIGALPALPEPGTNAAPTGDDDGVYFGVQGVGLVRLDATGEWEVLAPDAWNARLTSRGWLAITTTRIFRSDGEPIAAPPSTAISDAAMGPDGTVWATGGGHYARWTGSAWALQDPAPREPFLSHVAVDGAGTVWLAGERAGLFRLRDGALEPVETSGGSIRQLDVDPEGRLVVTLESAILTRSGEAWSTLSSGARWGWSRRADGALVTVGSDGVVVTLAGAAPRPIPLDTLGVPAGQARGVGFDGAGRLWIDTDVGMVALEPSLDRTARWYPPGTVEELATVDGTTWIGGIGAAPVLPAAAAPIGYVHGRVTRDGAPVAGAWIELCDEPSPRYDDDYGGTPCHADEDASGVPTTSTLADGTFHLFDVPEEDFDAAIHVEGQRWVIRDLDCCDDTDHPTDVGTITVP